MLVIQTDNLKIGYQDNIIVDQLNLNIPEGEITALVGANGSGKSTILKSLARLMKPKSGAVYLDGKAIHEQHTREVAKKMAILPQNPTAPEGLTVLELVTYGRFPHQKGLKALTIEDKEKIAWAIEMTGISEFANRPIDQLSGGQRQRAWIAMALAQDTNLLFLDEPTTFLDMAHQLEVLELLQKLNRQEGRTIVMVVHDLNHASRYAGHMVAIKNGTVMKTGTPKDVMKSEILEDVFGVRSDIIYDPRTGQPLCLPFGLCTEDQYVTAGAGL
ncbi:ABC transporter ATP-binding protein [Pseudalkalibacillus hwajinpoensis]|uniref:ABC transporter ATP-binding protein n=1 Tax=Guptibacillus hwajinpoensis TaxID=208199 RepID=UPI00325B6D6A